MGVSDKIAQLNHDRFENFSAKLTLKNAKQALFAYEGDVYKEIPVQRYDAKDLDFAQKHVRILSGLYGILKPLDLIQPYRLEMSIKLKNPKGDDLYTFWGDKLTKALNVEKDPILINLASKEYSDAIQLDNFKGRVITPVFKDKRNGELKVFGMLAKRARGMMTDFIIQNRITKPEDLKKFTVGGYKFHSKLSTESEWTFTR